MKHPALTKASVLVIAVMAVILFAYGIYSAIGAFSEKSDNNYAYDLLSSRIADYEAQEAVLAEHESEEKLTKELAEREEQHADKKNDYRTELMMYTSIQATLAETGNMDLESTLDEMSLFKADSVQIQVDPITLTDEQQKEMEQSAATQLAYTQALNTLAEAQANLEQDRQNGASADRIAMDETAVTAAQESVEKAYLANEESQMAANPAYDAITGQVTADVEKVQNQVNGIISTTKEELSTVISGLQQLSAVKDQNTQRGLTLALMKTKLEKDTQELEELQTELNEVKSANRKITSLKVNLSTDPVIKEAANKGKDVLTAAKSRQEALEKQYRLEFILHLLTAVICVAASVAGVFCVLSAYEKLKGRRSLVLPAIAFTAASALAEVLMLVRTGEQCYPGLIAAVFGAAYLAVVLPQGEKAS